MLQSTREDSPFFEGIEVRFVDSSLTGSYCSKILSRSGRFCDRGGGSEARRLLMASTSKKFRKGGEFGGSYSRGQSLGGDPARPIQSLLQAVAGGPPQTS